MYFLSNSRRLAAPRTGLHVLKPKRPPPPPPALLRLSYSLTLMCQPDIRGHEAPHHHHQNREVGGRRRKARADSQKPTKNPQTKHKNQLRFEYSSFVVVVVFRSQGNRFSLTGEYLHKNQNQISHHATCQPQLLKASVVPLGTRLRCGRKFWESSENGVIAALQTFL